MDSKKLLNLIKFGLFTASLTPLIVNKDFYFPFVGPKSLFFMGIIEIVFFCWLALIIKEKQYRPRWKNPLVISVLVFLGTMIAAAIFGANISASFWSKFERMTGIIMLCHLTAFFLIASTILDKRGWRQYFFVNISIALIVALWALFDTSPASAGGGPLGNDSFWGVYILFNIFIALYLFFTADWRQQKPAKIFAGAAFLILIISLFLEGSQLWAGILQKNFVLPSDGLIKDFVNHGARAVKISLVAGLGLLGALWLTTRRNLKIKIAGAAIFILAILTGITIIILAVLPQNPINQLVKNYFGTSTIHGRVVVWQTAWQGFLDRPLLGWGPENFELAFTKFYNPCQGSAECADEIWFDRAHNIIFDTLVSGGAIGFAAYLAIFGAAFWILWKNYRRNAVDFCTVGIFTTLLLAYFLQNLTVFDMIDSYLMFFLVLGFIASLGVQAKTAVAGNSRNLKWFEKWGVATAALICFVVFVFNPLQSDYAAVAAVKYHYLQGADGKIIVDSNGKPIKQENNPFGSDQRLTLYRQALSLSPVGKFQIRQFFAQTFLDALRENKKITREEQIKEFEYLAAELEKSVKETPLDYKSEVLLGQLYNQWSLIDSSKLVLADNVLRQAIALSPQNQQGYWRLIQTKVYERDLDSALTLAQTAYDLYPANARSKAVLDEIKALKQKTEQ